MIPRDPAGRRTAAWLIRLGLLGAIAVLVLAATIGVGTASRPAAAARGYDWVTSWAASPQDPVPGTLGMTGFHDQTVRDIIVPSAGGNRIRLELTNAFGRSPLQVGRVTVAVSIYLPGRTGVATRHTDAQQVNWVSTAGDHAGEAGVSAFARDVLDQPGVRDVIVLEGINDIGLSVGPLPSDTGLTPARVVAGYRDLIAQAHARGVRIFGATLLPYQGAGYYSLAGEAIREAVNAWIRTSGAFDGVIDFDAVMRDPADPLLLNPAYDSGDRLHPSDAGYQAMADAINLDMLLPRQG